MKISVLKKMTAAAVLSAVWMVGMSVRASAQGHQREHERKKEMKQERKEAKRARHRDNGHHYGRIRDDHYRAHFGREHAFRMVRFRKVGRYHRFAYSGYQFGFVQPWPRDWRRDDHVYVEYVGGGYFLCNPRRPGLRISLTLF